MSNTVLHNEETSSDKNGEMSELHFLNVHHSFPLEAWDRTPTTSSPGASSPPRLGFKEKLRTKLRQFVFGDYLLREQEYQANLVRLLNRWKNEAETREHGLRHALAVQEDRVRRAEDVLKGLERIIAVAGREAIRRTTSNNDVSSSGLPQIDKDYSYLLLENRYRGSEEVIAQRLSVYPPYFKNTSNPIAEIGCGRGELLSLFRQGGIPAYGLELDEAMVERSRSQGLDVRLENGLSHLRGLSAGSLGGVIAIQVVEHLPYAVLRDFLELCRSRIAAGGIVIVETIDTSSLVALSQNYFRDPTHAAPLHPETLSYLFELAGLEVLEIKKLSPYPPGFELRSLKEAVDESSSPALSQLKEAHNENVEKLNRLLYGFQDYSIVARVPRG